MTDQLVMEMEPEVETVSNEVVLPTTAKDRKHFRRLMRQLGSKIGGEDSYSQTQVKGHDTKGYLFPSLGETGTVFIFSGVGNDILALEWNDDLIPTPEPKAEVEEAALLESDEDNDQ